MNSTEPTHHFQINSAEEKINSISEYFSKIMLELGLNLQDPNLIDTPKRVAKMYVTEIFNGLNKADFPKVTLFENTTGYEQMLIQKNINLISTCAHHFLPFYGQAAVAYFPQKKIIGLSKLNRVVKFLAQKPQVQENLTQEIGKHLQEILQTNDIAITIKAKHFCIISRGAEDKDSETVTFFWSGVFKEKDKQKQFLNSLI